LVAEAIRIRERRRKGAAAARVKVLARNLCTPYRRQEMKRALLTNGLRFLHHIIRILVQDAMRSQDPVMVIYDLGDQWGPFRALPLCATMTYHVTIIIKGNIGLQGEEERVTVTFRDDKEAVAVEIVSTGKARPFMKANKRSGTFIGQMQSTFLECRLLVLRNELFAAALPNPLVPTSKG
jgi:hypothetical protein